MKFITNSKQFHKALETWVFLLLFLSAVTDLFYRVSKDLLSYTREDFHWLMLLHKGELLCNNLELI